MTGRPVIDPYCRLTDRFLATMIGSSWPTVFIRHDFRKRTHGTDSRDRDLHSLDFSLFGTIQCVIDLDAEVSNSAFQLRMPKLQLNRPQVPCCIFGLRRVADGECGDSFGFGWDLDLQPDLLDV